ncbi:MAG: D-alanyl-D-alanine carboxypeptidase family protein, partial [Bacilli bacterium]
ILYGKNIHKQKRIASITKIMTAILAIESGKMEETVTITPSMLRTEGSSIYLVAGQKMKLEDLVYGLMLRSGNDAALSIAEYVGGSKDGFVYMMNEKAAALGMKNTNFDNPSGLDTSDQHYSTAYDMALLTRYSMENPTYREITGTKVHRVPASDGKWVWTWKNKNRLLTELYPYTTGGKTGFTKKARRTLVTSATKEELDLICVTLNDGDDWRDHSALYEKAFKTYHMRTIIKAGKVPKSKSKYVKYGVFVDKPLYYPLSKDEENAVKLNIELMDMKGEIDYKRGKTKIGKVEATLNGQVIGVRHVYAYSKEESFATFFVGVFEDMLGMS